MKFFLAKKKKEYSSRAHYEAIKLPGNENFCDVLIENKGTYFKAVLMPDERQYYY